MYKMRIVTLDDYRERVDSRRRSAEQSDIWFEHSIDFGNVRSASIRRIREAKEKHGIVTRWKRNEGTGRA